MTPSHGVRLIFSDNDVCYLALLDAYARYWHRTHNQVLTERGATVIARLCTLLGLNPSSTADTLDFSFSEEPQMPALLRRRVLRRLDLQPWLLQSCKVIFSVLQSISPEELTEIDITSSSAEQHSGQYDLEVHFTVQRTKHTHSRGFQRNKSATI